MVPNHQTVETLSVRFGFRQLWLSPTLWFLQLEGCKALALSKALRFLRSRTIETACLGVTLSCIRKSNTSSQNLGPTESLSHPPIAVRMRTSDQFIPLR